jgi:hypothetical protein
MKRLTVAIASLTLVGVAALAVDQYLDEPASSTGAVATGASGARSAAPWTPPALRAEPGAAPAMSGTQTVKAGAEHELRQRYRSVDLGRPFFQWALAHPEQGGAYYARKLAGQCKGLVYRKGVLSDNNRAYEPGFDSQAYQRKIAAIEQLRRRCGDLSESELDDVLRQTDPADLKGRDPLLNIARVWEAQAASRDERARKTQALFVSQMDPLLADDLGARLFRAQRPGTIYFDGREWSLTDTPLVVTAIYLLPCELGMDCSAQTDPGLAMACSSSADCHVSREDKALKEMLGGNKADLAAAQALSRQMAAALRSGDPSRLARGS